MAESQRLEAAEIFKLQLKSAMGGRVASSAKETAKMVQESSHFKAKRKLDFMAVENGFATHDKKPRPTEMMRGLSQAHRNAAIDYLRTRADQHKVRGIARKQGQCY